MRSCVVVWTKKSQVFWGRRGTFSGAPPPRLSRSRPNFYTPCSLRSTLSLLSFIPIGWVLGELCRRPPLAHRYIMACHGHNSFNNVVPCTGLIVTGSILQPDAVWLPAMLRIDSHTSVAWKSHRTYAAINWLCYILPRIIGYIASFRRQNGSKETTDEQQQQLISVFANYTWHILPVALPEKNTFQLIYTVNTAHTFNNRYHCCIMKWWPYVPYPSIVVMNIFIHQTMVA